jgi:putative colanic acid biosynthesis UDP-glucose lipid carrier transferase
LGYYCFNFNEDNLYFFSLEALNNKHFLFLIYSSLLWIISTYSIKFYNVYRFTSAFKIQSLLLKQAIIFYLIVFSFVGLFRSINIRAFEVLEYIILCFLAIGTLKLLSFYFLKKYRQLLDGNKRNIIIVGTNSTTKNLIELVSSQTGLGYNLLSIFEDNIEECLIFLQKNSVDEIYCSMDELSTHDVNRFIKEASVKQIGIKFLTETDNLATKKLKTEYYGYVPVLSTQESELNQDINVFLKRTFDIIFSLLVILFILPWVSIILFFLIKIESRGPLFYRHKRNGLNYKEFTCFKFRTLKINTSIPNEYVKKNDSRVTRIGRVLRKYSIDELPQFINVFKGDMSVVGPRPHMPAYTDKYSKIIERYSYIFRHSVKPGLTGLAQVKGYRGEIKSDEDIINRIKYDIFYIENWSLILDLKIIFQTVFNIIKGEEKAY